jgi:hypothetical protein
MGEMVYQFKAGAHIPKGVTPNGVAEERDRIKHDYGKATIENSVNAVMSDPDKYPNLRAFGPANEEDAMRRGIAAGIQYAYRAVVIDRPEPKQQETRQVRVFHSVPDDDGDLVYEPIQAIRESPRERKWLIGQLRRDVRLFRSKMEDVLAEIEEASLAKAGRGRATLGLARLGVAGQA